MCVGAAHAIADRATDADPAADAQRFACAQRSLSRDRCRARPVTLTIGDAGEPEQVEVQPVPYSEWRPWAGDYGIGLPPRDDTLYLSAPGPSLWWQMLSDEHSLYVRYEQVTQMPSSEVAAIADAAVAPGVDRVILDLRQNGGGDNHFYAPLLSVLIDPRIDRPGRLFVLTDRLTFSAAANFATDVEQATSATFAGEAICGGLNFWGDALWVELPHYPLPMRVGISTRYWQKSAPDDPRLTIEPEIALPVLSSDYFSGRDPVLEAITST